MTTYLWFRQWYVLGGNAPWTSNFVEALRDATYERFGL